MIRVEKLQAALDNVECMALSQIYSILQHVRLHTAFPLFLGQLYTTHYLLQNCYTVILQRVVLDMACQSEIQVVMTRDTLVPLGKS